jgi:hypothetical protein
MGYAKDFPYEYERCFDGVDYRGLALFINSKNGDLDSEEDEFRSAVARLRGAGVPVRTASGVYGSRRHANALRGWMVFIPYATFTPEQDAIIQEIEDRS